MSILDDADWSDRARAALEGYSEALLRAVAARLVKPRANQPVEDVLDKLVGTLTNAPVIDRRLRELPPECRKVLAENRDATSFDQLFVTTEKWKLDERDVPVAALQEINLSFLK